jgi:hypothetical protein
MDEYMAAAALLVGKPGGGLTSSEALARAMVRSIPGQEEQNADHLLEAGAAIRCNNLPALAWKINPLLDDPVSKTLDAVHHDERADFAIHKCGLCVNALAQSDWIFATDVAGFGAGPTFLKKRSLSA